MFDTSIEFVFKDRLVAKGQELTMRWPSDEEWFERAKRTKILLRNLGRGVKESDVDQGDTSVKLFEKIKLNGAPPLSLGEATLVIDNLAKCSVRDSEIDGDDATIVLTVAGGAVTHHLHLPTADQILTLQKNSLKTHELPHGLQDIRVLLEPGAKLYDECKGHSEDYKGAIPAIHKDAVVRAVKDHLDRELNASNDEEFF